MHIKKGGVHIEIHQLYCTSQLSEEKAKMKVSHSALSGNLSQNKVHHCTVWTPLYWILLLAKKIIFFLSFYDLGSGNLNGFIILITLQIGKACEIGASFFLNTQMEKLKMVEGIFQTSWKKKNPHWNHIFKN